MPRPKSSVTSVSWTYTGSIYWGTLDFGLGYSKSSRYHNLPIRKNRAMSIIVLETSQSVSCMSHFAGIWIMLRPPWWVYEACLHQAHKPCVIRAMPSHNHGNWASVIHSHGFVMALLQWHKVHKSYYNRPSLVCLIVSPTRGSDASLVKTSFTDPLCWP